MEPKWLDYVRKLAAIAQSGLAYCDNKYDIERYEKIREIAAEMAAEYSDGDPEKIRHLMLNENGYATPKVDARGVVFKDGGILLVRELMDGGKWTIPGGWVDVGESPREAVEREVLEESGYEVEAKKLLAVFDKRKHNHPPDLTHIYKLFILCELRGGRPSDSIETAGAAFFKEDEIPELSVGRTNEYQIKRMFEHLKNPDLPTDFD